MRESLKVPVLLMAYARPNTTKQVFEEIRKAQPSKLYVALDGPKRNDVFSEQKCAAVKELVSEVDWPCEVHHLFRNENLGCRSAVSQAITWFFQEVEQGIILEDDCLPNQHFFTFCEELLEKYKEDERVMHISGTNLQFGKTRGTGSYYFSNIPSIWGWAGWRRSWKNYDLEMTLYPKFKASGAVKNVIADPGVAKHIMNVLQLNFEGKINTWDHQYGFSLVINNGLCIVPNVNLISNLGFSKNDDPFEENGFILSRLKREGLEFPLKHPKFFIPQKQADLFHISWDINDTTEMAKRRLRNESAFYSRPN